MRLHGNPGYSNDVFSLSVSAFKWRLSGFDEGCLFYFRWVIQRSVNTNQCQIHDSPATCLCPQHCFPFTSLTDNLSSSARLTSPHCIARLQKRTSVPEQVSLYQRGVRYKSLYLLPTFSESTLFHTLFFPKNTFPKLHTFTHTHTNQETVKYTAWREKKK